MRRITLSLDEALADEFDAWCEAHAYENRSEAFRDLLRARMQQQRIEAAGEGHCIAIVSYVYDHHERQLASRITSAQHAHHGLTLASQHVHLDHHNCLETTILRGYTDEVRQLATALIAERGVRHGHAELIPIELATEPHSH